MVMMLQVKDCAGYKLPEVKSHTWTTAYISEARGRMSLRRKRYEVLMKVRVRLQPSLKNKIHPKNVSDVSLLVRVPLGLTVNVELDKLLVRDRADAARCVTSLRTSTNPL